MTRKHENAERDIVSLEEHPVFGKCANSDRSVTYVN